MSSLEPRKRRGRQGALFRGRTTRPHPQQPLQPLTLIARQPAAYTVAVHGQLIGCLAAALHPPLTDQYQ
jgi:hypothetical protein